MRPNNKKNQQNASKTRKDSTDAEETFETPNAGDETDYGFEFSRSRMLEPRTSRRCSTLRQTTANSQNENDSGSETHSNNENQEPPRPNPVVPNRRNMEIARRHRKQLRPEQRQKKLDREIKILQNRIDFLIPRLPFSRVVREIMIKCARADTWRITFSALEAIQTAAEMYLTQRMEDAYLLTRYRNRVTLEIRDLAMVGYFCQKYGRN